MKSEPTFFILSYFWLNEWWPYYQKDVNQVTLNHTTLFNLAVQILSNVNLFLNQTPNILLWDKLGWLKWFWQFLIKGLSSFDPKGLLINKHGLAVYVKERIPFARDLSLENSADPYLCFQLASLQSSVLLLFPLSITFFIFIHSFSYYFI